MPGSAFILFLRWLLTPVRRVSQRLSGDRRGNVLILTAAAMMPLTFAVGFGVDYARGERLQTRLDAAADAAALAAVDPSMITQSDSVASAAATAMFTGQTGGLSGLTNLVVTPTITDTLSGTLGTLRTVTVSYTAKSTNAFGGILRLAALTISGKAVASASQPPNINFYVAMDTSPSMLLASTTTGLAEVSSVTGKTLNQPYGCDFSCHEQLPHTDNIYVTDASNRAVLLSTGYYGTGATANTYYLYNSSNGQLYTGSGAAMNTTTTSGATTTTTTYSITDSSSGPVTITKTVATAYGGWNAGSSSSSYDTGYWADGYWLTQNYRQLYPSGTAITLRMDDEKAATQQLIPYAANQASQYNVTYQMQLFAFNWTHPSASSPVTQLNTMSNVNAMGSVNVAGLFPAQDYWLRNSCPSSTNCINDQATEMYNTLVTMKGTMPTAGSGSPTSTPQEVLFIITDGMVDEAPTGSRVNAPMNANDLAQCTAIKSKGIKIAILYTQYLAQALVGDGWSQANVAPYLPAPALPFPAGNAGSSDQDLAALQSCASPDSTGVPLVQQVTTDGDLAAALQALFNKTVQSSRLIG